VSVKGLPKTSGLLLQEDFRLPISNGHHSPAHALHIFFSTLRFGEHTTTHEHSSIYWMVGDFGGESLAAGCCTASWDETTWKYRVEVDFAALMVADSTDAGLKWSFFFD
jgi:hypothetical protein